MIGMNSQLQSNSLLTLNLTLKIFELRNGNRELYKSPRENKSTHPNLIIYGFSWVPLGGRRGIRKEPGKARRRNSERRSVCRLRERHHFATRVCSEAESKAICDTKKSTRMHALFLDRFKPELVALAEK